MKILINGRKNLRECGIITHLLYSPLQSRYRMNICLRPLQDFWKNCGGKGENKQRLQVLDKPRRANDQQSWCSELHQLCWRMSLGSLKGYERVAT